MAHGVSSVGRSIRALGLALMLVTTTACGALGGPDKGSTGDGKGSDPERSKIKVALLTTFDVAPLHLAIKSGYFRAEGLDVELAVCRSGTDCVNQMINGDADIAMSSYTPYFLAKAKGAADIKLVADATAAAPNALMLVATPTSTVKGIKDLAGKRVAITARNTMSHLMTMASMRSNGVDYGSVKWVELPFPDMLPAVQKGDVDVAYVAEPFVTSAKNKVGAVAVFDTATGSLAGVPLTGYGAIAKFVKENPRTVAAFQRAMRRATNDARGDRSKIEPLLVEFSKVDSNTAKQAALPDFQSGLEPERIQRVPDLMLEFGVLAERIDAAAMIVPPAR